LQAAIRIVDIERQLEKARGGDPVILGHLLESYRSHLLLLARIEIGRQLQGKVDASDIVQETFLDAHRYFPGFRGTGEPQFVQWLRGILAGTLGNTLRRYLGTQARDVRLERSIRAEADHSSQGLSGVLIDSGASPSQHAIREEQTLRVAEALSGLPEDYQRVIVLRHVEGLTFPEIAERMERSLDSVQKLWLRGLTRLRERIAEKQ
jgi:RNA polymerase sigma-70 factor (ECF subfamily)